MDESATIRSMEYKVSIISEFRNVNGCMQWRMLMQRLKSGTCIRAGGRLLLHPASVETLTRPLVHQPSPATLPPYSSLTLSRLPVWRPRPYPRRHCASPASRRPLPPGRPLPAPWLPQPRRRFAASAPSPMWPLPGAPARGVSPLPLVPPPRRHPKKRRRPSLLRPLPQVSQLARLLSTQSQHPTEAAS